MSDELLAEIKAEFLKWSKGKPGSISIRFTQGGTEQVFEISAEVTKPKSDGK